LLEEKIETLTKEVVKLRQVIEAGGLAAGAAGAATTDDAKPAATKKKAAAKKVVEPTHDADEVGTIMRKAAKEDKPAVRKHIKDAGCADLAELLTKPELFDAAYAFAEGIVGAEEEEEEDDDDV
jgi:hypothetical protein